MVLPVSRSPLSIASIPSRRRTSANFASRLTCSCTRPLKLFDLAIPQFRSMSSALARLVVAPMGMRRVDVVLLALLHAASQQDHQIWTILTEVDTITGPEIDPVLEHAFADRLHAGKVALLQPDDCARHLGARDCVDLRKPFRERRTAVRGDIVADVRHEVTLVLLFIKGQAKVSRSHSAASAAGAAASSAAAGASGAATSANSASIATSAAARSVAAKLAR